MDEILRQRKLKYQKVMFLMSIVGVLLRAINVSALLFLEKPSPELDNFTCAEHPTFFPAITVLMKMRMDTLLYESFIWALTLWAVWLIYKTYANTLAHTIAAMRISGLIMLQLTVQTAWFLKATPRISTMIQIAVKVVFDDLSDCPNIPDPLEKNIHFLLVYIALFPINFMILVMNLVIVFKWHRLSLQAGGTAEQRNNVPRFDTDLMIEYMSANSFPPSYEEATSPTALPSYEHAVDRARNVASREPEVMIPSDLNPSSPVTYLPKSENGTTTYGAAGQRHDDVQGSQTATSVTSFETAEEGRVDGELMTEDIENNSSKTETELLTIFADFFSDELEIATTCSVDMFNDISSDEFVSIDLGDSATTEDSENATNENNSADAPIMFIQTFTHSYLV